MSFSWMPLEVRAPDGGTREDGASRAVELVTLALLLVITKSN
jgi:hypothetical protein